MTIVKLVGGSGLTAPKGERLYVEFRGKPANIEAVEKSLPELKKQLAKKWPVLSVRLDRRVKNPTDALTVVFVVGLVIVLKPFARGVSKAVEEDIKHRVGLWLESVGQKKEPPRPKRQIGFRG
jgi:hypothetical protein